MSKRTDLVKEIMKVADHYKEGELYATGAMTDIGILLDNYEKSKAENLPISGVRLSCFQEVWQKWCELDNEEFDKWLHSKMHEA